MSDQEQILSDAISRTFKALSDAGKEVVYALDVPTFSTDGGGDWLNTSKVQACSVRLHSAHGPYLSLRTSLSMSRANLDEVCSIRERDSGTADGHALMEKLVRREAGKYKNIHVVDLSRIVCHNEVCRMNKHGKMLYKDSNHLGIIGSAVAAPVILKAFWD